MALKLPNFVKQVTAQDMQFWIDLCREIGVTRGTATVNQVLWRP